MIEQLTRRDTLKRSLAATSFLALIPDWATPALAQGEVEVPFTDLPANFNPGNPAAANRQFDIRKINGLLTPRDQFFTTNHFNRPQVDPATYRLKFTGMVNKPTEFTLDQLKAMKAVEMVVGFECSGNSGRAVESLCSCAKFKGVPLRSFLKQLGVGPKAREVVFFALDRGMTDIAFRQNTYKLEQQFARSITLENAMKPEPIVAYLLNGEPLSREQGFPVRLIIPGWYGVAQVKWLTEVHLQEERFLGNYQARWYRTLRGVGGTGKDDDPQTQWVENEVTRMRLKSAIARVTKSGDTHNILGFVLNDGSPVKSVEVQIDGGQWQRATLDPANTQYSWKLFNYKWTGATAGEHTLVSRATDANGTTQPTTAELNSRKKTFLEDNSQYPRKVKIG